MTEKTMKTAPADHPSGVILQGSIGPGSRRINLWCAHYGRELIAHGCRTKTAALSAAQRWYAGTTEAQRAGLRRRDKAQDDSELLISAAKVASARGERRLALALTRFAGKVGE